MKQLDLQGGTPYRKPPLGWVGLCLAMAGDRAPNSGPRVPTHLVPGFKQQDVVLTRSLWVKSGILVSPKCPVLLEHSKSWASTGASPTTHGAIVQTLRSPGSREEARHHL